nr:unnamed protein product [Trichobilharzia regenti]
MSNSNNGSTVGRHSGVHQNTPGSSVKSQRSYSNRPRMGASAIVTNLHDHSTTSSASADNYQQSTLPGRGKLITQHHHWNNGNHKNTNPNTSSETMMTTPSSTDLDEFYRLSRSPSTPGLCINNSSSSNNHSKYSPHTMVPSVTTTTTPPATTTIPQKSLGQMKNSPDKFKPSFMKIINIYAQNDNKC